MRARGIEETVDLAKELRRAGARGIEETVDVAKELRRAGAPHYTEPLYADLRRAALICAGAR